LGATGTFGVRTERGRTSGERSVFGDLRFRVSLAPALVAAAVVLSALLLSLRFTFYAPGVRAAVETALVTCATLGAWWLTAKFYRERRLSNLLSAAALVTVAVQELVFSALPAITDAHRPWFGNASHSPASVVVAALFAGAAFAPRSRTVRSRAAWSLAAPILCATVLATILVDALSVPNIRSELTAVAVALLLAAGAGFARAALRGREESVAARLAGASILIAAAWLYDLVSPAHATGTVSGRDCLRAIAYGLIISVAIETRGHLRQAETAAAAELERRRLARDIHDGIAQDLAFIGAYGERLAGQLGATHPLVVASRRALTASRGAILDLSGGSKPTVVEALRSVSEELATRHQVKIIVDADGNADNLSGDEREEVVRIAREAMVNAIKHGRARTIVTRLSTRGRQLSLVIKDDGCGLGAGGPDPEAPGRDHIGHGLRTMRERATAIGGRLTIHQPAEGGTVVEVDV
jgi:signal transduction histidine kinase